METFTPDKLIAGDYPLITDSIIIGTDADIVRGAILGRIDVGAVPATGTADGGNTGNGTVTSVLGKKNTKVGTYTIICVTAITNGGVFQIKDPDGKLIAEATILAGAGGIIAFSTDELSGVITDGSTDFIVDDLFDVIVPAGSGKYIITDDTNLDGSQNPVAILLKDALGAAADVADIPIALSGEFAEIALTVGNGAIATRKDALRNLNIYFKATFPK